MDAAVIPTAEAIKRAHCGETADKMLLKDCMVAKAQIGDLSEQNISSTEELKGYVSRAPVASASTTRCIKSESPSAFSCSFSWKFKNWFRVNVRRYSKITSIIDGAKAVLPFSRSSVMISAPRYSLFVARTRS
jgi:hypothetical protein